MPLQLYSFIRRMISLFLVVITDYRNFPSKYSDISSMNCVQVYYLYLELIRRIEVDF